MWDAIRRLSREARPEGPTGPSRADVALGAALVPVALLEAALREGLRAHAFGLAFAACVALGLALRRARPFAATALAFGPTVLLFGAVARIVGPPDAELYAPAVALLVPYSLLRWGTGREIRGGLVFVAATYVACTFQGQVRSVADAVGGAVVLLFPAAVGTAVRFRAEADRRALERVRLEERAVLARDLHDTVAHHVAAIAVQAQAGRTVLATRPEAAAAALAAIEGEARRTLTELRGLVRQLRDAPRAELSPQPGLAALVELGGARGGVGDGPAVVVELGEGLDGLGARLEAALYRIAQEATTNARRHARGATRVVVRVAREGSSVRLVVEDDGAAPRGKPGAGFGIVGMAERAALLGGTLDARPVDGGGFVVAAELPLGGGR